MKRGSTAEPKPVKKRPMTEYYAKFKTVFALVMPWIFPGFYHENWVLAFKTYLSLNQTCRTFRYFNLLRRWIGWLCPEYMSPILVQHSFPVRLMIPELIDMQATIPHKLWEITKPLPGTFIETNARRLCIPFPSSKSGNFEWSLSSIPFFNVFEGTLGNEEELLVYVAPNFAETVLFCFAAMMEKEEFPRTYFVYPSWKCRPEDFLIFRSPSKLTYLRKTVIKQLKKLGQLAPMDAGFLNGSLPGTAYSEFLRICDIPSTPEIKIRTFVHSWFPLMCLPITNVEKAECFEHIELQFQ